MKYFSAILFFHCCFLANGQNIDSIIKKENLQKTIAFLASDDLQGRLTGTFGELMAANFIKDQFIQCNLHPLQGINNYLDTFNFYIKNELANGFNVVGILPSKIKNDTSVIFSAHYDHIGIEEHLNLIDNIYNGANDNASGVATLLELVNYYSKLNDNKYNLIFVAFSGEELGLIGSKWFAKNIESFNIKAVINFDMLGKQDDNYKNKCAVITENKKIIPLLNKNIQQINKSKNIFFTPDNYPNENLFYRSDHISFINKTKNIFTLTTFSPYDKYYHSTADEFNTINFNFLLTATKNIALACKIFYE